MAVVGGGSPVGIGEPHDAVVRSAVDEPALTRPFHIPNDVLESFPVRSTRILHVLRELGDRPGSVRTSGDGSLHDRADTLTVGDAVHLLEPAQC